MYHGHIGTLEAARCNVKSQTQICFIDCRKLDQACALGNIVFINLIYIFVHMQLIFTGFWDVYFYFEKLENLFVFAISFVNCLANKNL